MKSHSMFVACVQAAQQALSRASLIIADAYGVSELLPQYPKAM